MSEAMTSEPAPDRFEVVEEKGSPRGDLYELEQKTYYHVLDRHSGQVIMTFEGLMEASLSRDTGLWDDYFFSGAREVNERGGIRGDTQVQTVADDRIYLCPGIENSAAPESG